MLKRSVALLIIPLGLAAGHWMSLPGQSHAGDSSLPFLPRHQSPSIHTVPLPPLVFVSRNPVPLQKEIDAGAVPGLGPEYRTVIVGGRLVVREPSGVFRVLTAGTGLLDVSNPTVSWDGSTIVFAGVEHTDSSWRLYRIRADGSGLAQMTFSDRQIDLARFGSAGKIFERYDDFDPCFLPDGRIIFASTRYPSMATTGQVLTSNLFLLNPETGAIHRVTSERNGAEEPTIDPVTGRVVYARWWANVDRPSNTAKRGLTRDDAQSLTDDIGNIWHAVTITPDGHDLKMYAGFPRTRFGSQTYKPSILPSGAMLSTFAPRTSMTPVVGGSGVRWFKRGADVERHIAGVRSDESLRHQAEIAPPYAVGGVHLRDDIVLLSYSEDGADYGLYMSSLDGTRLEPLVDFPGTLELDAQVLAPRAIPPILHDEYPAPLSDIPPAEDPVTYYESDSYRFDNMNIFANGGVDQPIPDAPRIAKNARIRFFMNVQRQSPGNPEPSIFLKDAIVHPNGQIHEPDLPADVPLFEQVIDDRGRVLRTTDGKLAHVSGFNYERVGAGPKCVGCHAGHTLLEVPINGAVAEWFNVSPSAHVVTSSSGKAPSGVPLNGRRLVDRQARTGGDTVYWVADEKAGASASLQWEVPVEVREFVLYGIPHESSSGTTVQVHDCEIRLFFDGRVVGGVRSTGPVEEKGTRVRVPVTRIDAAEFIVRDVAGTIYGRTVAGLAEVETIARISYDRYHSIIEE